MDFNKSGYDRLEEQGYAEVAEKANVPVEYQGSYQGSYQGGVPPPQYVTEAPSAVQPPQGAFVAHIFSHRYQKYIALGPGMEPIYSRTPTRWLVAPVPSGPPHALVISAQWQSAPSPLELERKPVPAVLRAVRAQDWRIGAGYGATEESLFVIEHGRGGSLGIRSLCSGSFICCEGHAMKANRPAINQWESFGVEALTVDQMNLPYQLPQIDPLVTGTVSARVRIRSVRYGRLVGFAGKKIRWGKHNTEWDLLHASGCDAYLIRNAAHPDVFFSAAPMVNSRYVTPHTGAPEGVNVAFMVEKNGSNYAIKSLATGLYCVALCNGMVANREKKKMWEEYQIEILQQLH